ncbi:MAG: glycoside hydrolase family 38 C-terminal domain-containing protein [Kiritimatiellia bacterium]
MKNHRLNSVATLAGVLLAAASPSASAVTMEEEIPAGLITVTASSAYGERQAARHLVDGSGLTGDRHDADAGANTMWHTTENPTNVWVRFDFSQPQTIAALRVWNHNQAGCTDRGFRSMRIVCGTESQTVELKRGTGLAETVPLAVKTPVSSVTLVADSNHGGAYYGLSEVRFMTHREVAGEDLPFPAGMECKPQDYYGHRADGKAGRVIEVTLTGAKLYGDALIEAMGEQTRFANLQGAEQLTFLLPAGVTNACTTRVTLRRGKRFLEETVNVPARRQWVVYLFPHSHVDIGYTNPQDVVERIHMRNLDVGIELGRATAGYPEGARHVWNNEVLWAVESWLKSAPPERKKAFVEAVQKGWIGLSASYCNANTSTASDEELLRFFAYARQVRELTGAPIDTLCQFDVPGMSWGVVRAAAQNGVRAILDFPNPSDRTGSIHVWRNKPFYWVAPDGRTRVLYLQIFPYNLAWKLGAHHMSPKPYVDVPGRDRVLFAGTPDFDRHSEVGSFARFITSQTAALENIENYPYDLLPFAWSLSDNSVVDAGLPDFVKAWNEQHAFPKLVIADASTIARAYESRFASVIPERRGDLTEYWTDGLGSDALRVGCNRLAREDLIQSEILWSLLRRNEPAPAEDFYAAWRWIQLGTEHTWGYMFPDHPLAREIEATKAVFFENALKAGKDLLNRALPPGSAGAAPANVTVFNTLSWPRTGLVTLPPGITGLKGAPNQALSTGERVFLARDVPALGSRNFPTGQPDGSYRSDLEVTPATLENSAVKVTLDPVTGDISSLVDKGSGHDFALRNGPYALNSYRYLHGGDAPAKASGPSEVRLSIKENGPVLASLLVESKAEGCRWLRREIRLLAGQRHVEIINTLDKIATRNKEGIHFAFAFNLPGDAIPRMDIPWGVMNPLTDQLDGANKNWLACQRWVDVSAPDRGATWVPIEAAVVQFGDITANLLGSVHPGSWSRKIGDPRTIVSWALNNHWHTNFPLEQGGVIPFRYAILPHGAYDPVVANRFGLEQNRPLLARAVAGEINIKPLVSLDNPRVFVSTLSGGMARLRSASEKPEEFTLNGRTYQIDPYGLLEVGLD